MEDKEVQTTLACLNGNDSKTVDVQLLGKGKKVKRFSSYKIQDMVDELEELKAVCYKLGHTGIILNIILTKGRLAGLYDPMSAIPRAKISKDEKGDIQVNIVSYKELDNGAG